VRATLRELGIALGSMQPGPTNTIADVPGVRVGHFTRIFGDGRLRVGSGPVRTGISVVVPPGDGPWRAASHVINGYGKSLGLMQIDELGEIETPLFLTNTLAVGAIQQGYLRYARAHGRYEPGRSMNVVVGECNDGHLSDLWGLHVEADDATRALADAATADRVVQGAVGAGTGMVGFGHKGGIGSASRQLPGSGVLGALVLVNCGRAGELRLDGRPVLAAGADPGAAAAAPIADPPPGSIIIVLATDASLDNLALGRAARRATHGLARTGAVSDPGSGDVVLAFATAEVEPPPLDALFRAVVESTEEAILNALATAETVRGRDGHVAHAIPASYFIRAAASPASP
jgi:D-aminopeptidase